MKKNPTKKDLITDFQLRQHMLKKDFEIFYYCEDSPTQVELHSHSFYELYFFIEGNTQVMVGDTSSKVKQGDIILIPPNTKHYNRYDSSDIQYRRFVLWISKDYVDNLISQSEDFGYVFNYVKSTGNYIFNCPPSTLNAIQSYIFSVLEELSSNRFGKESHITLSLNSLILYLNRTIYQLVNPTEIYKTDVCGLIASYIQDNFSMDLSLDHLSQVFYLDKYYISHLFKDSLGISIHQYIIKTRIKACKTAMLQQGRVGSIYTNYGFNDYSVFYRAFKKEFGSSPKEYLKNHENILIAQ